MDANDLMKGMDGENVLRQYLKQLKHKFGQIDLASIDEDNQKVYLWEVKHQERFKAPPFDGHGLPPIQIDFRLRLAYLTKMIPVLVVVEPEVDSDGCKLVFMQRLDVLKALPKDKKFITKNGKRVIFHIDSFVRYRYDLSKNNIIKET